VRIVLDTTILVRANEHSRGLARELLLTLVESKLTLLLSNFMSWRVRYPRLRDFYDLTESDVFDYVSFLRRSSEPVKLNPLVMAPIRDVNDVIVMQTAIIGEADILCTTDDDFFEKPASEYLWRMGIAVVDDIALMQRLRSRLT